MSGLSLTQEALDGAIALARQRGFEIVRADDKTLLLDLDTPQACATYERVLPIITEHFGVASIDSWKSKSGKDHYRLALTNSHEPLMRYALQAVLGSDAVREALILCQFRNGCDEPSILFRPPQEPEPVF